MRILLAVIVSLAFIPPCHAADALEPTTQVLIAAGDIAECGSTAASQSAAARTAALAARFPDASLAILGDVTYPKGAASEYAECFAPTWGKLNGKFIPAPGNHDYGTGNANTYFNYFGKLAGADQRGYYSRNLGNWHIVSLNSMLTGEEALTQLRWLQADLAASQSKHACLLAMWHHPVFSSGLHGNKPAMLPALSLLEQAGADLILTGHDHHYERFAHLSTDGKLHPAGPRHFVVGTGGASLYPVGAARTGSEVRIGGQHGVLMLKLGARSYAWEFLGVGQDAPLDAGKDQCHAPAR